MCMAIMQYANNRALWPELKFGAGWAGGDGAGNPGMERRSFGATAITAVAPENRRRTVKPTLVLRGYGESAGIRRENLAPKSRRASGSCVTRDRDSQPFPRLLPKFTRNYCSTVVKLCKLFRYNTTSIRFVSIFITISL